MKGLPEMPDPTAHPGRFADARRILDIAEVTPGLPFPSVCATIAAFNFTQITHAQDAAEAVAMAETILSYALDATFSRKDIAPIGSSEHWAIAAFLPSGLEVDIVAKAQHMREAGQDKRELSAVAA
jgi:hypothetical protein